MANHPLKDEVTHHDGELFDFLYEHGLEPDNVMLLVRAGLDWHEAIRLAVEDREAEADEEKGREEEKEEYRRELKERAVERVDTWAWAPKLTAAGEQGKAWVERVVEGVKTILG